MGLIKKGEDYHDKIEEIRARRQRPAPENFSRECPKCRFGYSEAADLVEHWRHLHAGERDSLCVQLESLDPTPFYPTVATLLLELTILFESNIAYQRAKWDGLDRRLQEQLCLRIPFELRILGWTNRPQGAFRLYWGNKLQMQGIFFPWESREWDWLWGQFEEFIRIHHPLNH